MKKISLQTFTHANLKESDRGNFSTEISPSQMSLICVNLLKSNQQKFIVGDSAKTKTNNEFGFNEDARVGM